jgi:hypothetical protein
MRGPIFGDTLNPIGRKSIVNYSDPVVRALYAGLVLYTLA